MANNIKKGQVKVLGIDIAEQSFELHCVNERSHIVLKKNCAEKEAVQG